MIVIMDPDVTEQQLQGRSWDVQGGHGGKKEKGDRVAPGILVPLPPALPGFVSHIKIQSHELFVGTLSTALFQRHSFNLKPILVAAGDYFPSVGMLMQTRIDTIPLNRKTER